MHQTATLQRRLTVGSHRISLCAMQAATTLRAGWAQQDSAMSAEDDSFPLPIAGDEKDHGAARAAAAHASKPSSSTSAAAAAATSVPKPAPRSLSSAEVAAWLAQWGSGSDADLLGVGERKLRREIISLARRLCEHARREQTARQKKWFEAQEAAQRVSNSFLPPVDRTAPTAFDFQARLKAADDDAAATALVAAKASSAASDSESSSVVAVSTTSSRSEALVVPDPCDGTGGLQRLKPARRAPLLPKQFAETQAARHANKVPPPNAEDGQAWMLDFPQMEDVADGDEFDRVTGQEHVIDHHVEGDAHDVSRTVRQMRLMAAHRCYVCKCPLPPATADVPLADAAAASESAASSSSGVSASSASGAAASAASASTPASPLPAGRLRHAVFTNHCSPCGAQNLSARSALVDLRGRVAVLTGARIKIGYAVGVRLLRCGATLYATTRFPANALLRYQQEADYAEWAHRLHLLYADLCSPAEVTQLAERIRDRCTHVDMLICNAAQTVRRPQPYYSRLNDIEQQSQRMLLQRAEEAHTQISIEPHKGQPTTLRPALRDDTQRHPKTAAHSSASVQSTAHTLSHGAVSVESTDNVAPPRAAVASPPPLLAAAVAASASVLSDDPSADASSGLTPAVSALPSDFVSAAASVPPAGILSALSSAASAPLPSVASSSAASAAAAAASSLVPSVSTLSSAPPPLLSTVRLSGSSSLELRHSAYTPFSHLPSADVMSPADAAALFPSGCVDSTNDHEPLDLRSANSWSATSADVDPRELAEVLSTNAMAPFVLAQQLRPWMERAPTKHRYCVFVSSMEGKLNRSKADQHVHTNMAKAALNALTRTVSAAWAQPPSRIYVNSVDTGWNSEERAVRDPKRDAQFETPLDCIDGAARILDPIFTGERDGRFIFGQFLKDYQPSDW